MSKNGAFSGMSLAAAQVRHQELLRQGFHHQGVVRDWENTGRLDRSSLDNTAASYRSEGKEVIVVEHQFGLDMYWRTPVQDTSCSPADTGVSL